jgi:hypothetical protein
MPPVFAGFRPTAKLVTVTMFVHGFDPPDGRRPQARYDPDHALDIRRGASDVVMQRADKS